MVSNTTLALTQASVDQIVLVDDTQMLTAMRWLWQEANQLVEPAGAASIAAIQAGKNRSCALPQTCRPHLWWECGELHRCLIRTPKPVIVN
jgi:threonine dehydratase